tara:strand:+ start:3474 stop:5210 length:1737 start_codon:yes stop_codon:yes gene_type:complete
MRKLIFYSRAIDGIDDQNYSKFYEWNFDPNNGFLGRDYGKSLDSLKSFSEKESFYLEKLYEKFLKKTVSNLNAYHRVNEKEKNWEIIIGPWLRVCLFGFYERWQAVNKISRIENVSIITEKFSLTNIVTEDFEDFTNKFYEELWNAQVYTIMCHLKKITVESKLKASRIKKQKKIKTFYLKDVFFIFFHRFLFFLFNMPKFFIDHKFIALINIPGSLNIGFNLIKKKSSFPLILNREFNHISNNKINSLSRIKPLAKIVSKENLSFEDFIGDLLWMVMPKSYLEDFADISYKAKQKLKRVRLMNIVSSSQHWFNDFLKIWIFHKKINDPKIKTSIWQHGGTYGFSKVITHQEYIETKVFDRFYSWGWGKNKKNIFPMTVLPKILKRNKSKSISNKNQILIILTRVKTYSKGDPWDSEEWNIDYMNQLMKFSNLANSKKKKISFRLNPSSMASINLKTFLRTNDFTDLNKDKSLNEAISNSDIVVITQNSTALIQSFYANKPTILFWNERLNGIRIEAKEEFQMLVSAGIFMSDFKEISSFFDKDKNEIQKWWNSSEVQRSVKSFLNLYASNKENIFFK